MRRQQFLLILFLFFTVGSLWELVLSVQDNSFVDGIGAGLGLTTLSPDERAMRLFHWVSAYDDDITPSTPAAAPRGLLTPRAIVEHRAYFREDCGSKVWLLCFMAQRAGLKARELRLCDATHTARHVVCELWVNGRWAVFDPTVELDFRRRDGLPATAVELRDPALLAANAARIHGYNLRRWRFDHPERLHFEKIPRIGGWLRRMAARVTGRPAEELSLPVILGRPRLLAAGSLALMALLFLLAAGRSDRRVVRMGRRIWDSARLARQGLALQATDQD